MGEFSQYRPSAVEMVSESVETDGIPTNKDAQEAGQKQTIEDARHTVDRLNGKNYVQFPDKDVKPFWEALEVIVDAGPQEWSILGSSELQSFSRFVQTRPQDRERVVGLFTNKVEPVLAMARKDPEIAVSMVGKFLYRLGTIREAVYKGLVIEGGMKIERGRIVAQGKSQGEAQLINNRIKQEAASVVRVCYEELARQLVSLYAGWRISGISESVQPGVAKTFTDLAREMRTAGADQTLLGQLDSLSVELSTPPPERA